MGGGVEKKLHTHFSLSLFFFFLSVSVCEEFLVVFLCVPFLIPAVSVSNFSV